MEIRSPRLHFILTSKDKTCAGLCKFSDVLGMGFCIALANTWS